MGTWLGRRTEPRVDFREPVRVIWPGEVSGVVARAVNLSPTGILVDAPTPTPCPVGSDVLCDVALPRGQRLLRGRVAHRRLLSTAKVGMGIEFIDLSPRELAELRHIVDEQDQRDERDDKPQRVKVRFDGTPQIVRARAVPTEHGFRLTTTLPFLKAGTAVDIALAPETGVSAKGWVSSVTLDRTDVGGMPRLLIDVDTRNERERARVAWDVPTPVVETLADQNLLEAVPEPVWEPDAYGAPVEPPKRVKTDRIFLEAPLGEPQLSGVETPSLVSTSRSMLAGAAPAIVEFAPGVERGAMPEVEDADTTQVVSLEPTVRPWRAASRGMLVGAIGLAVFVLALLVFRTHSAPVSTAPTAPTATAPMATTTTEPAAPVAVAEPAPVAAPAPPPVAAPASAAPAEVVEPVAPANSSTEFTVGLAGTLEGVQRYPLRAPDGVAFNLPHAQSSLKVGVYRPGVRGLRAVWVRDLPGGGTHLRFYFGSSRARARIELDATGAHAFAP
jgi:PilZ domain